MIIKYIARLFAWLLLCGMSTSFISACSTTADDTLLTTPAGQAKNINANEAQKYDFYTVRHGDNFQKIAAKFNVAKEDVMGSNGLHASSPLKVGQKLRIPIPSSVQQQATLTLKQHSLRWPADGKIVRVFTGASKSGSRGINIAGALGQAVKASGDGKVVYSGSSLPGYGKTIIVKHNDSIVTVYALNKSILVKEGQAVKAGEKIAEMGNNAQGDVILHFEVRVDGKPQNPLLYLEKRS